ncbi:MAG: DUF4292 domain-containing protein [Muribaculaceae bacterium]|nr:DUF4292 domain-containing protein [Muribaculaceae bacterium]
MIKNLINIVLLSILAILLSTGCSKKVVNNGNDASKTVITVVNDINNNQDVSANLSKYHQADWSSFKSGGNAELKMGGKSMSSSMHIRMKRGKAIYVSLRPYIGIEVAKMVISGDSILLVDKLHKRFILEKASLLTNGIPVTVDILQDIFLGRAFELGKGSFTQSLDDDFTVEESSDGKIILKPRNQFNGFEYNFIYDNQGNILSLDVTPSKSGASTYSVAYSDHKASVAGRVPSDAKVATQINGRAFELNLVYKDMKWNEDFDIDTKTPNNYKRLEAKDIMQILGGSN